MKTGHGWNSKQVTAKARAPMSDPLEGEVAITPRKLIFGLAFKTVTKPNWIRVKGSLRRPLPFCGLFADFLRTMNDNAPRHAATGPTVPTPEPLSETL